MYLGEISDAQRTAWCKTIDVIEEGGRGLQVAIFPEDRLAPQLDCAVVRIRLNELRLTGARQWGACWLALEVWHYLELDEFCRAAACA